MLTSNGTELAPQFQALSTLPYYSLTPFIVGPIGDPHAQFNDGATAIAAAQVIGGTQNIYFKPGSYAGFTLPSNIRIIGLDQNYVQGFASSVSTAPSVQFTSAITSSSPGNATLQNIQVSSLILAASTSINIIGCYIDTVTTSGTNYSIKAETSQFNTSVTLSSASVGIYQFSNCFIKDFIVSAAVSGSILRSSIDATGFSASAGIHDIHYNTFTDDAGTCFTLTGSASANLSHNTFLSTTPFAISTSGNFAHSYSAIGNSTDQVTGNVSKLNLLYTGSDVYSLQNGIHTTDATVTTLASVVLNQLESITMWGTVTGAQSDHTNAVGGTFNITAYRPNAGNVTLAGFVNVNVNSSSAATFTANVDTGTQTVRIQVTGVVAVVYNWVCSYSYQKVLLNT